ncbi:hypothetical protein VPH35_078375 [Triticum aestivum]
MGGTAFEHENSGPWTRSLEADPSQGSDKVYLTGVDSYAVCRSFQNPSRPSFPRTPRYPRAEKVLAAALVLHRRRREIIEDSGLEFLLDAVERFPLREEFADNLEHPDPIPLVLLPKCPTTGLAS